MALKIHQCIIWNNYFNSCFYQFETEPKMATLLHNVIGSIYRPLL